MLLYFAALETAPRNGLRNGLSSETVSSIRMKAHATPLCIGRNLQWKHLARRSTRAEICFEHHIR